ncbi:WecB/TagA/CpsF family glycosyltransferase [Mycobacterium sp. 852002-51163_SCH5372311]|uniref:WecB/TagA/CpsF family glycosyltransferase n=1 Tax=Mycobacterium sp. 852002-51163_SCH5372311 TaxID=1834097 RepID=UPI000B188EC3|nr:WecB/TagA/CpsF family glycosyltransferase [Mycobacterium sp. 852002-51163_SCH5372311]
MGHDKLPRIPVRMVVSGSIVERCDAGEVLSIIAARLRSPGPGLAVGSVNLDHLHHFRSIGAAPAGRLEWLLLADGMPIAWRGRLLTASPWPRVTGADLLPALLTLAEDTGQRVGFFGGSPATHHLLARHVYERYPRLNVSGMWAPNQSEIESDSDTLAAAIRGAETDILVVSLGKPRQEQWVDRHGHATGARIFLPCGGAVDFLAGKTRRAPQWMQRLGLEWFYRLRTEPRRLARRYLLQGPFALLRATRAQLICYPGVYYAGAPAHDHAVLPTAATEAASA